MHILPILLAVPIFLNLGICVRGKVSEKSFRSPEAYMNIMERIHYHGYEVEAHRVVTEDGYVIALYRIPYGFVKNGHEPKSKPAVLMVPGMGGSPETYLLLDDRLSIPFYLADRGYEVWLLSVRGLGHVFTEKHVKYDWDKDDEYWNYSLHDIANYDVAASIDHILAYTGQSKLSMIGHSAGGNEFYALLSEKPSYNDKIKVLINWGSSPVIKRFDCPLLAFVLSISRIVKGLLYRLDQPELLPIINSLGPLIKIVCEDYEFNKLCFHITGIIGSHRSYISDPKIIPLIASLLPRFSIKQIIHFMDNCHTGEFRQFDYGLQENLKVYGSKRPPAYNLTAATAPGVFFIAEGDSFILIEDIYDAMKIIPNTIIVHKIPYDKFTHIDYLASMNATEFVYEPTYRILRDADHGNIPPPIKVPSEY